MFVGYSWHMANKCLAKPSRSLLQLAILDVYMRWINYHSATVNISVFIEQRNIVFQSGVSLKTMRFLGVLLLRESWDSRQNRELGRRAVADLFVVIAWTSQKASKVHKSLSKLAIALIWNIQSPHEDNRTVTPVKCTISAHRGTGTIYDSCRFDIGRFRVESGLIHERCLHLSETFAYRNAHNNLFFTLRVIQKLKIGCAYQLWPN